MSLADAELPPSFVKRHAESIGMGAWLLAAAGWVAWLSFGDREFGPMHLVTAAGLVIALAVLARRGWVRLFGPVLFYEGLRAARRGRFFFLRWLYAVGLLLLLLWVHLVWGWDSYRADTKADPAYKQQARLAQQFFYAFAAVQFSVVVLLTPAYVAGGIAEEKERRTLDFLLATDLRPREIVFGKLLARLANLALFVMTGLPVLSLMQFFGGIDPGLLLASFAVTGLTAASLAGLSILMSVQRRRARDAIVLTYLAAVGYAAVASLTLAIPPVWAAFHWQGVRSQAAVAGNPPPAGPPYFEEISSAVQWLNSGNPFHALSEVIEAVRTGNPPLADVVQEQLQRYAIFHVALAAVCIGLAVLRLRPIALAQAGAAPKVKRRFRLFGRRRPPIRNWPMLWKEVRIEGGLRFGWIGRILVGLVVVISFAPLLFIVYMLFIDERQAAANYPMVWDELGKATNVWVRSINTIVSTLMLLGVAVRAAGAFGGETDRDTLTSLMTTPLTTAEIAWAKFVGALSSVRLFLFWLGAVWLVGLVTGGVNILSIPLQIGAWLAPAAFMAALGLYFSAACKTTLRATTWTILGTLLTIGGHWVCMGMCCFAPLAAMSVSEHNITWVFELEAGLSPPFVFAIAPFRQWNEMNFDAAFGVLIVGAQVIWLFAAAVVGQLAHNRFRRLTNRHQWMRVLPPPPRRPIVRAADGV